MLELQTTQTQLTMSSREIAELVESRHDSVKRSMETLRDKEIISFPQSVETSHD
jgi:phage regulator Rha-like protein